MTIQQRIDALGTERERLIQQLDQLDGDVDIFGMLPLIAQIGQIEAQAAALAEGATLQKQEYRKCGGIGPATVEPCDFVASDLDAAFAHFETTGHDMEAQA